MMNMNYIKFELLWTTLFISLAVPCVALSNYDGYQHPAAIDIVKDNGESFSIYPVNAFENNNEYRAYLEAIKDHNYGLRIQNTTHQRLGFVIAVDGRNIISGKKSHLKHNENMYILGPYETQIYKGWRTSSHDIHRFIFTHMNESYAHAFGDDSAMGVIAVSVFKENIPMLQNRSKEKANQKHAPASGKMSGSPAPIEDLAENEAGTGFGTQAHSHARYIQFNPMQTELAKYFYKYEWRETLCHKHIIDCGTQNNRFWPHHNYKIGFAPYPPGYYE